MRVTEGRMLEMAAAGNERARERIASAGRELSTGIAVDRPSDSPTRWADGMRQTARLQMAGDYRGTVERAREKLDATDNALARVASSLVRAREVATGMASGTVDGATRVQAAVEIRGLFADMLAGTNARAADGEYLLAGMSGDVAPFDANGIYQGDDQVRYMDASEGQRHLVTVPGSALTAAEGVDVFGVVGALEAALLADDQVAVQATLAGLTEAIAQVADARGRAGSASSALSSTRDALDDFQVQLAASIETAVAADPVTAATDLATFSNQLETSRVVAARIAQLMDPNR